MSENTTKKVWGIKNRLLETKQAEVDLLHLDANTACSIHYHDEKINRFVLLSGDVRVKTDLGEVKLEIERPFDVEPPLMHQFIVKKDSLLLELAYVRDGYILDSDIVRKLQGGKFIRGKFYTLDQLKEKNWLEYKRLNKE